MKDPVKEFLRKNGKKGGIKTKENNGPDYYKKIGKLGGKAKHKKK